MLQNEDVRNSSDKFDVLGLQVGRNHGRARITKFWVTEFNDTCQSLRVTPYDVVQKQRDSLISTFHRYKFLGNYIQMSGTEFKQS